MYNLLPFSHGFAHARRTRMEFSDSFRNGGINFNFCSMTWPIASRFESAKVWENRPLEGLKMEEVTLALLRQPLLFRLLRQSISCSLSFVPLAASTLVSLKRFLEKKKKTKKKTSNCRGAFETNIKILQSKVTCDSDTTVERIGGRLLCRNQMCERTAKLDPCQIKKEKERKKETSQATSAASTFSWHEFPQVSGSVLEEVLPNTFPQLVLSWRMKLAQVFDEGLGSGVLRKAEACDSRLFIPIRHPLCSVWKPPIAFLFCSFYWGFSFASSPVLSLHFYSLTSCNRLST